MIKQIISNEEEKLMELTKEQILILGDLFGIALKFLEQIRKNKQTLYRENYDKSLTRLDLDKEEKDILDLERILSKQLLEE